MDEVWKKLFSDYLQHHATVLCATFCRVIAGNRVVLALPADINDAGIDALTGDVVGHGLCAAF